MKKMSNPVVCQTTGEVFDANDTLSRLNHFENDRTVKLMLDANPPELKERIKNWEKDSRNRNNDPKKNKKK